MLVLLDNADNGPVPTVAGPRDRLRSRWHADHLDHELADGASPDSTVDRSLRAQFLVRFRTRRELAHSMQRILAAATQRPTASRLPAPLSRAPVAACATELNELISRLLAPGPVAARGVAQARLLLTDAGGPLYRVGRHAGTADLRVRVCDAAGALSALDPAGRPQR
jgi:hypothetical protein